MARSSQSTISYLLLFPFTPSASQERATAPFVKPKDAPYFFNLNIEFSQFPEQKKVIEGREVNIVLQIVDGVVLLATCTYQLPMTFGPSSLQQKTLINQKLRQFLLDEYGSGVSLIEEYCIVRITHTGSLPDALVQLHRDYFARLLRPSDTSLTQEQSESILKSRVRSGEQDLSIIDWEGALVISRTQDFLSEIELLKIGNYQLIRYRMLDSELEKNLHTLRSLLTQKFRWLSSPQKLLVGSIQSRLQILLDFEWTNQALLLIGEWYTAQFYRTVIEEFYIEDWKKTVSDKLDTLTAIDETIRENLSFSWSRFLDIVQIAGWMILLLGSFYLFFHDLGKVR